MRVLDLFCKAGGAGAGYAFAGCEVVGVDIDPQPNYPFEFLQMDALEAALLHGRDFDFIHASPPCQHYSRFTPLKNRVDHPDMIAEVRRVLLAVGKPFVIENVAGARRLLRNPIMLCGSMFGVPVFRHRFFEIWPNVLVLTPPCKHDFKPVLITDHGGPNANGKGKGRKRTPVAVKRAALGIEWMTELELSECVPPAYTEFICRQLVNHI